MLKKGMISIVIVLFFIPLTQAAKLELTQPIAELGKFLSSLLSNHYAVYFLVAIFLYMLLFNLFQSAIEKTHLGGSNSKPIAGSLAALSTIGIVGGGYYVGFQSFIDSFVTKNSLFPSILLAVVLFFLVKKHAGNTWAFLISGVLLLLLGGAMDSRAITITAILFFIIFLFVKFSKSHGGVKSSSFTKDFNKSSKSRKETQNMEDKGIKILGKDEKGEGNLEKKEANELNQIVDLYNKLIAELKGQMNPGSNPLNYKVDLMETINSLVEKVQNFQQNLNNEHKDLTAELDILNKEEHTIEGEISTERRGESSSLSKSVSHEHHDEEVIDEEKKKIIEKLIDLTHAQDKNLKSLNKLLDEFKENLMMIWNFEKDLTETNPAKLKKSFEWLNDWINKDNERMQLLITGLRTNHHILNERKKLLKALKKDQKALEGIEKAMNKDEKKE